LYIHKFNGCLVPLSEAAFCLDEAKATTNARKHGVSFELACEIFFDPFVRVVDAGVGDEERDAAIGFTADQSLLFVVHVLREDDTIRLISARRAELSERRLYEDIE
jgi:uncharacterized DUF497 family protein